MSLPSFDSCDVIGQYAPLPFFLCAQRWSVMTAPPPFPFLISAKVSGHVSQSTSPPPSSSFWFTWCDWSICPPPLFFKRAKVIGHDLPPLPFFDLHKGDRSWLPPLPFFDLRKGDRSWLPPSPFLICAKVIGHDRPPPLFWSVQRWSVMTAPPPPFFICAKG